MKQNKLILGISAAAWAILLLVEGLTFACIKKLDMLPNVYLAIVGGILLILWLAVGALVWIRTRRGSSLAADIRRLTAMLLTLVLILGCGILSGAVSKAYATMDAISDTTIRTTSIRVFVRTEDPAQTIADAAGYSFGVMQEHDNEKTMQAVAAIEKELGQRLSLELCDGPAQMVEALLDGRVDAVIISSAYISILEENDIFENLLDRIREIHTVSLTEEIKAEKPQVRPTQPHETRPDGPNVPVSGTGISTHPFVVYISGSDTRSEFLVARNSDVNILAVVNPVTKQVLLVNTPRDYYIPNPAGGGALDKLTHLGGFGVDVSMEGLSDLYGMDIDYYAQICFTGFETLIDAVGGVEIYSDHAFKADDIYVEQGLNSFNGADALKFCRERYRLPQGDIDRGKNQMKVIQAVVDKLTSGTLITNYSEILDSLEGMFATDITNKEISELVKMQLENNAKWDVLTYSAEGYGSMETTYSMPGWKLSVMIPYQNMVDHGAMLIDRILAGEKLTQADLEVPES